MFMLIIMTKKLSYRQQVVLTNIQQSYWLNRTEIIVLMTSDHCN